MDGLVCCGIFNIHDRLAFCYLPYKEEEEEEEEMGYLLIVSVTMSCVLLLSLLSRLFYWAWWKPMRLQKLFKDQGIVGPPYRVLIGNIMEDVRSIKEAWSKPMNLSHKIVPRVIPFIHQIVTRYGISYLSLTLIFLLLL